MARSAALLNKIVFCLLLAVMVLAVIPYGTVDVWWEAVVECAIFAITAIWIVQVLLRGSWDVKGLLPLILPVILITGYAFAQTIQWPIGFGRLTPQHTLTIDRYQTYLTARKMVALTVFLGLLWLHTSTPTRFRWLVRVVAGLGFVSALFGIGRQLMQSPDSQVGFVLPFLFYGVGYGHFIYHNLFAYLMEMTFGILVGLAVGGGIRKDRILIYVAIAVVLWAALILSSSRGGVLGLVCQVIFLLFMSVTWYATRRRDAQDDENERPWLSFLRGSKLSRIVVVILITVVLVGGVIWMGGEDFASRMSQLHSNEQTTDNLTRTAGWRATWNLIKHQPWTGVGFGTYFLGITQYQTGAGRFKLEEAHNDYLDLAASGGAVAVGLALWWMVIVFMRIRSSLRSKDSYRRAASLGAAAGILSVLAHSFVDFGLQITGIAIIFLALIVIACADGRVELNMDRIPRRPRLASDNETR